MTFLASLDFLRFAAFLWIIPLREALSIKPVAVAKVAFASSGEPVSVTATTLRAALRIAALIGAFFARRSASVLTMILVGTHTFFPSVPPDESLPRWMRHHFEYLPP